MYRKSSRTSAHSPRGRHTQSSARALIRRAPWLATTWPGVGVTCGAAIVTLSITAPAGFSEPFPREELSLLTEATHRSGVGGDTLWFGGQDPVTGLALEGGVWDFEDGTLQGWTSIDLTDVPAYFRHVTSDSALAHGDPVDPTITAEPPDYPPSPDVSRGSLWCGVHDDEAQSMCWPGGQGYGNATVHGASKAFTYVGGGNVTLSYDYFVDSETQYDFTYIYVISELGRVGPLNTSRIPNSEGFGYSGGHVEGTEIGEPFAPAHEQIVIDATYLQPGPGPFEVEFRFISEILYSDALDGFTGFFNSFNGPFGVDNIRVAGVGLWDYSDFEPVDENGDPQDEYDGWAPFVDVAGRFMRVAHLDDLDPVGDPIDCGLSGHVLLAAETDGTTPKHPSGQAETLISNTIDVSGVTGVIGTVVHVDGWLANVESTGTSYRIATHYYPWTCPETGTIGWTLVPAGAAGPYAGTGGGGAVACSTFVCDQTTYLPAQGVDSLKVVLELYSKCDWFGKRSPPCDASNTDHSPYWDNIKFGLIRDLWHDLPAGSTSDRTLGVAWGDADGNGLLDLYAANDVAEADRLLLNNGGSAFTDTLLASLRHGGWSSSARWGDYDSDGDEDLVVAASDFSSDVVYRNDGGGTFVEVAVLEPQTQSVSVFWVDVDGDGHLDIYMGQGQDATAHNRVYRNEDGAGSFAVFAQAGPAWGGGSAWGDCDGDGDQDLYQAGLGPSEPNQLFRNDGIGLVDVTPAVLADPGRSRGVAWGDYDNDADLDLFMCTETGISRLFRNEGGGAFADATPSILQSTASFYDVAWGDYDNDADLDLYLTASGSDPNCLLRNDDGGHFVDVSVPALADTTPSTGCAWADVDGDGDLDLGLGRYGAPNRVIRNDHAVAGGGGRMAGRTGLSGNGNHWLLLDLIGTVSNTGGIGTRIRTVAGGVTQIREVSGGSSYGGTSGPVHLGLGTAATVDSLEVRWPSGESSVLTGVAADQSLSLVEPETASVTWTDATTAPLADVAMDGRGVAWGDYDGDGDPDLLVTNGLAADRLFRNDGGAFVRVDGVLGTAPENTRGVAWADHDNDGDLDLYHVNRFHANHLFRNEGGGLFADVTTSPLGDTGDGRTGTWADYDGDGDVDLYLVNAVGDPNHLFRNEGGDVFVDVTTAPMGDGGDGRSAAWADYDDDGDPDLFLANAAGPNRLFRNDGAGTFVDVADAAIADVPHSSAGTWDDYDGDLDLDLYVANANGANRLFQNQGDGTFVSITGSAINSGFSSRTAVWADYDHDRDLDLFVSNHSKPNQLFRNEGGSFVNVAVGVLADDGRSRGAGWADFDADGDPDLFVANRSSSNFLIRNELQSGRHWLHVDLVGTTSNRSAIGAKVLVHDGAGWQLRHVDGGTGQFSQSSLALEFGLGPATMVDSLRVVWPSGTVQDTTMIAVDQRLTIVERAEGSVRVAGVPATYALYANRPNPFNPITRIAFDLAEAGSVNLAIYDVGGRRVRLLANGSRRPAGRYTVIWDGRDSAGRAVGSGVYFYRLTTPGFNAVRRMTLLR